MHCHWTLTLTLALMLAGSGINATPMIKPNFLRKQPSPEAQSGTAPQSPQRSPSPQSGGNAASAESSQKQRTPIRGALSRMFNAVQRTPSKDKSGTPDRSSSGSLLPSQAEKPLQLPFEAKLESPENDELIQPAVEPIPYDYFPGNPTKKTTIGYFGACASNVDGSPGKKITPVSLTYLGLPGTPVVGSMDETAKMAQGKCKGSRVYTCEMTMDTEKWMSWQKIQVTGLRQQVLRQIQRYLDDTTVLIISNSPNPAADGQGYAVFFPEIAKQVLEKAHCIPQITGRQRKRVELSNSSNDPNLPKVEVDEEVLRLWGVWHAETILRNPMRRVVIGDLHGDIEVAFRLLKLARVLSQDATIEVSDGVAHLRNVRWVGGPNTQLVWLGDLIDRGPYSLQVMQLANLLEKLSPSGEQQAQNQGQNIPEDQKQVVLLLGNHELAALAAEREFRTSNAYASAQPRPEDSGYYVHDMDPWQFGGPDARIEAFGAAGDKFTIYVNGAPQVVEVKHNGRYFDYLSKRDQIAMIDGVLYAHGGIHAGHLLSKSFDNPTEAVKAYNDRAHEMFIKCRDLRSEGKSCQGAEDEYEIFGAYSPTGTRKIINQNNQPECENVKEALEAFKAKRMVVAHNPTTTGLLGVHCDGLLVVVDVKASKFMRHSSRAVEPQYNGLGFLEVHGDEAQAVYPGFATPIPPPGQQGV